jgi:hypothetical protein
MELLSYAQDWCQAVNEWMADNGNQPVAVTDHATEHRELCGQPVTDVEPARVTVVDNTGAGQWVAVFDPAPNRWALEEG